MVTAFDVGVFVFFFPGALWFGYRSARSATLYRALASADPETSTDVVDGEPAAIEGTVTDVEPPDQSENAFDDGPASVAAFVWQVMFPKSGANVIDFEDREVEQAKATFASGMASGEYAVTDGRQSVQIDPEWLLETHEATELSEVTVGGVNRSRTFHTYLWDSPYVHLTGDPTELSLERFLGVVDRHNSGVDLDDYDIESKAIREGETLAVRGEVRVDQGDPVIHGTDETPLTISDQGFDGLGDNLRARALRNGGYSLVLLAISCQFVVL